MPSSKSPAAAWLKSLYATRGAQEFIARAYRSVFRGEHGEAVLNDLRKALFMLDTTATRNRGQIDPYQMAVNEGRRQAYLHIAGMILISGDELKMEGPNDYDHRDERREPAAGHDDDGDRVVPRWGGGYDPDLDGPIPGSDSGSSSSSGGGGSSEPDAGTESGS